MYNTLGVCTLRRRKVADRGATKKIKNTVPRGIFRGTKQSINFLIMKYYDYTDKEIFAVIKRGNTEYYGFTEDDKLEYSFANPERAKSFQIEQYTLPDEKQRLMSDFLRLDAEEHRKKLSISVVKKSIKYTEKRFK